MKIKDLAIPGESTARQPLIDALEAFGETSMDHLTRIKSGDQSDLVWIKENNPHGFASHILTIFTTSNMETVHILIEEDEWKTARELWEKNRRLTMAATTWVLDPDVRDLIEKERRRYLRWRVEHKGDDFRAARDKIFGHPRR